jgi:adenylate kinase
MAGCDLIVQDLHSGDPRDVRLALQALAKGKFEEEKVLILISSLMAWKGTPNKQEEIKTPEQMAEDAKAAAEAAAKAGAGGEDGEEKPDDAPADQPEEAEEEDADNEDGEVNEANEDESIGEFQEEPPKKKLRRKFKHLAFSEKDYGLRDPIEEYRIIKEIEDEVLNFKKENVKTYVISAGILYGKGEAIFNSHIQKAWLQEPMRLPYVGDGNNLVPTIHVTDLARMVFKVFEKKPERKYIFAIDNNLRPTQKKLIASISNGIGTGLVESQDIPETFKKAHPKMTPI